MQPRERDTLRMRFEQVVEMSAPARAGSDSTATRRSAMLVLSRSVVERVTPAGAVVLAVTDSVALTTTGADPRALDAERRGMQGRRARMRVTPSGASELLDASAGPSDDAAAAHSKFPGTLPTEPVAVGASWTREMPLPWRNAGRPGGKIAVVFRLDSLGAGGTLAYVSLRGSLARDAHDPRGLRVATTGTLTGAMLVDLRRGWVADSHSTFVMTSVLTPPDSQRIAPARVKLKVTQWLRAM